MTRSRVQVSSGLASITPLAPIAQLASITQLAPLAPIATRFAA